MTTTYLFLVVLVFSMTIVTGKAMAQLTPAECAKAKSMPLIPKIPSNITGSVNITTYISAYQFVVISAQKACNEHNVTSLQGGK